MKLCIDGLSYFLHPGELGEYSREIIKALDLNKNLKLHLIKDTTIKKDSTNTNSLNATLATLSINRKNDDYSPISNYLVYNKIPLYHCFNNGFSIPKNIATTKIITTFHSIMPLEYEDFYTSEYKDKFLKALPITLDSSSAFISTTEAFKDELINLCNINENKISVIRPVISNVFMPLNKYLSTVFLRSKFNITKDFILVCGDFHRRNRLEDILEIFLRYSNYKEDVLLIFLNNINTLNFQYFNEIKGLITALGLSHKVKFISQFTDNDKVYFLNGALCYMDLSLYTTLDISLPQAYLCKCKVICSDLPSHREVLNDRGIFIDLLKNHSLNDVIEILMEIESINPYGDIDNFQHDNYYDSKESIDKLLNLYESLI